MFYFDAECVVSSSCEPIGPVGGKRAFLGDLAVTRDGQKFAVKYRGGTLVILDANRNDQQDIRPENFVTEGGLAWSPDGNQLAYDVWGTIWALDIASSRVRKVYASDNAVMIGWIEQGR